MSAFSEIMGEVQANAIADSMKRERLLAEARQTLSSLTPKTGAEWVKLYNAQLFLAMHSCDPELAKNIPTMLAECFDEAMAESFNEGVSVGSGSILPCTHE